MIIMRYLLSFLFLLDAFVSVAQYTTVGTATSTGNSCYQLTNNTTSQNGSVWNNQAINLNQSFDLYFEVNLGSNNGGADGMCFVLQPQPTATGIGGGGIGAQGISPSVMVEVDTWNNGNNNDIAVDHVGILSNGVMDHNSANGLAGPIQAAVSNGNIEDGQNHDLRIKWDAGANLLEVYFDCDLRLQYTGNIVNQFFNGNPTVYWGMTASTGGAFNVHSFCVSSLNTNLSGSSSDQVLCLGDSIEISAPVVNSTSTYLWTPNINISSTGSSTPTVWPTSTTDYIVNITDACYSIVDTITVEVVTQFDASFDLQDSLCIYDSPVFADPLLDYGIFSGTGITETGQFDPDSSGVGTFTINYDITGNCANSSSQSITVIDRPIADIIAPEEICLSDTVTLTSSNPGGSWLGPAINQQTGFYTPLQVGVGTYQVVYVVNEFCSNTDTVQIRHITPFEPVAPPAQAICAGDTLALNASLNNLSGNSIYAPTYQWTGGGIIADTNPGGFDANIGPGVYVMTVSASTPSGSCSGIDSVEVTVYPLADTDFPAGAFCAGITTNSPILANTPGIGTWSVNPITPTTVSFSPTNFIPANVGIGSWELTYTITDAASANGCGNSSTDTIYVVEAPEMPEVEVPVLCVGDSILFEATGGGEGEIEWFVSDTLAGTGEALGFGTANSAAVGSSFQVAVHENNLGCIGAANEFTVVLNPSPLANFSIPADTFTAPATIPFTNTSQGGSTYNWTLGGSTSTEENPTQRFSGANTYVPVTLVTTNEFGCKDTVTYGFYLENAAVLFNVPNVFTPNGDGCNDFFGIGSGSCGGNGIDYFVSNFKDYTASIYNRWGREITTFGPGEFWTGEDHAEGVYFYVIEATGYDERLYTVKGNVQLLRNE